MTVREQTAQSLALWNAARCEAQRLSIERLLSQSDLSAAERAAQDLVERCLEAGENAYPGAAYDIASAYFQLAKVHKAQAALSAALQDLTQARERFQALAAGGNANAARMVYATSAESGDCLRDLGQWNDAASLYTELSQAAELSHDPKISANLHERLGQVRSLQGRLEEALALYRQALHCFEAVGELSHAAALWQKIGMLYWHTQQPAQAEQAYRQALTLWSSLANRAKQAAILTDLGSLYTTLERLEEAADCHGQAATIYQEMHSLKEEGYAYDRLGAALLKLGRYPQAARALQHAIDCKQPFDLAAEPWITWSLLHDLERARGHAERAVRAWQHAAQSYLAYRRTGQPSVNPHRQLYAQTEQAIRTGSNVALAETLAALAEQEASTASKTLVAKLQAVLSGARDLALAADPALHYADAAELQLLVETLAN